ncbi:hypothetical protein BN1221_00041 [Brenneria goodwinii]|uniref:Uncharacterized protein n=1 Tax=Brenneria goodwinii TaxID=1109412 RepID=A0A0G4JP15_9GAMM|nr:hypothetical protein BN1221_00041 [Brenneria goodwinii]
MIMHQHNAEKTSVMPSQIISLNTIALITHNKIPIQVLVHPRLP